MRKILFISLLGLAAWLLLISMSTGAHRAVADGNLVVNDSFEVPVVTNPAGWDIFDSGTAGLGWTVEWFDGSTTFGGQTRPDPAHLELQGLWLPKDGAQYAELDTDWDGPGGSLNLEPSSVGIYQDLPTCSGGTYDLKYSWSPRPDHSDNGLEVKWGGVTIGTHSGPGASNTSWIDEAQIVTATSTTTRLEFVEVGEPDALGMFLDAVSVVEVSCPPEAACVETVNPHGKNVPPAGSTTLPGPKGGQNEDGFYELLATDDTDPDPQIFVVDTGSGTIFGPFSNGTKIKYTEANGAAPSQKAIGSAKGQAGAVSWHIIGTGDAAVFAVDAAGNASEPVSCLVPPPPK